MWSPFPRPYVNRRARRKPLIGPVNCTIRHKTRTPWMHVKGIWPCRRYDRHPPPQWRTLIVFHWRKPCYRALRKFPSMKLKWVLMPPVLALKIRFFQLIKSVLTNNAHHCLVDGIGQESIDCSTKSDIFINILIEKACNHPMLFERVIEIIIPNMPTALTIERETKHIIPNQEIARPSSERIAKVSDYDDTVRKKHIFYHMGIKEWQGFCTRRWRDRKNILPRVFQPNRMWEANIHLRQFRQFTGRTHLSLSAKEALNFNRTKTWG